VTQLCFNANGGSNPSYDANNLYCRQIARGPTGELSNVDVLQLNLGGYKTSGIDAQLDWRVPVGPGDLTLKGVVSRLLTYKLQNRPGDPFDEYAGTIGNTQVQGGGSNKPHWRGLMTLNYQIGAASLGGAWRYIGSQKASSCVGVPNCTVEGVKAFSYFDLNMSVRPADNFTIFANVNNLFDKTPPQYPIASGNVDTSAYDAIGRRVSVGARVNF
jgi:iron complex outermembrane receptor protein